MYFKVVACDLDGTLATDGVVDAATWEALRQAKRAGMALVLATGRALATFAPEGPYADIFDAVVAEDGAVVYFPRSDVVVLPFGNLNTKLLARLEQLPIPLERGVAIVATRVPHDEAVLDVLRASGGGATVEYNRGAVMVLPAGATKGTGLQYALRELGYSPRSVVACGDAENDRSLFDVAELSVAVANAPPDIQAMADMVLPLENGAGVRSLIAELVAGGLPAHRPRPARRLTLGNDIAGATVQLDPLALVAGNTALVGASGSGKSWLAGLLAEELLKRGYQICLVDPEGDYRGLRAFPHTLLLGGPGVVLPPVGDVTTLCEYAEVSVVLDLSLYQPDERARYVGALLRELYCLRARRGRPHWLLVDEAQSFCADAADGATGALLQLMRDGGVGIVSYRPSAIAPPVLAAVDTWLLTRLGQREELETIEPRLQHCLDWPAFRAQLQELPLGQTYLCADERPPAPGGTAHGVVIFRSGPRAVPHIRHLHKYLRAPLPDDKRFYFFDGAGRPRGHAASLWDFRAMLASLPLDSIGFHLSRGDLERWVAEVIHDDELARRLGKLARRSLDGEALRQALLAVVGDRYDELDRLI